MSHIKKEVPCPAATGQRTKERVSPTQENCTTIAAESQRKSEAEFLDICRKVDKALGYPDGYEYVVFVIDYVSKTPTEEMLEPQEVYNLFLEQKKAGAANG